MPEGDVCAICYGAEGDMVSAHLEHQHLFHLECLQKALEHSDLPKCPLCSGRINNPAARAAIPEDAVIIDLFYNGSTEEITEKIRLIMSYRSEQWSIMLMTMIEARRSDGVRVLLDILGPYDYDVKEIFDHAIIFAIDQGQTEILQTLLEYGASPHLNGNMAFLAAIECDNLQMVKLLVKHGVCLDAGFPLVLAKLAQRHSMLEYLLTISPQTLQDQCSEALLLAVRREENDYVKDFLEKMRDVELQMQAPLLHAVTTGNVEMARILLDAGADPCVDYYTAMWTAMVQNHPQIYKLLIASPKYKQSPVPEIFLNWKLFDLISYGADFEVAFLLDNHPGVDVNYGDGALFNMACRSGELWIVEAFLKHGARVTELSFEIATEIESQPVIDLLTTFDRYCAFEAFKSRQVTPLKLPGNMSQLMFDMFTAFFSSFSHRLHHTASVSLSYAGVDGDLAAFDDLLYLGADIHHGNDVALSLTMEKGCLKMAAEMVKRGADATAAAFRKTLRITDSIFVFLAEHAQLENLWQAKLSGLKPSLQALRKSLTIAGSKGDTSNLKVILGLWKPRKLQLDDIQDLLSMKAFDRRDEIIEHLLRHSLIDNV